ncbi:MAG: PorV/PorQ family protein [Candidatus Kapaibacterium sp.]
MRKIISVFILTLFLTCELSAVEGQAQGSAKGEDFRKVGAAGGQFLKIGVGARATAMGGAYGAISNDLTAVHWNPAGIAEVNKLSANFTYSSWFANFNHNFAAISLPIGQSYSLAAHFVQFGASEIEITTVNNPEGLNQYYTVSDIAAGLTFSGYLTEQFTFGITAKLVSQSFANMGSTGLAVDIGTKYDVGIRGMKLGFSIHNLGTEQRYTGQALNDFIKINDALYQAPLEASIDAYPYSLPIAFRAAAVGDLYEQGDHKVIGAFDFVTLSDVPEQYVLGAEYGWRDLLFMRGGYKFGHDQMGFSGGLGIKYIGGGFNGQIDYSISPTTSLGLINKIGIALEFGS